MKKGLFLLLVLVCFVSVSFPAPTGEINRVIFGGTTAGDIFVRDYEILSNGKWNKLRDLSFQSRGPVGTIAASAPNNKLEFNLYYSYLDVNTIKGRNILIDYKDFEVLRDTAITAEFGGFSVGGAVIRMQSSNPYRFNYVDKDHDVVRQKTRPSGGKPFGTNVPVYSNDTDIVVSTSFDWLGGQAAQILLHPSTGDYFGDFRSLTASGKPVNDVKRFRFLNDIATVSLGVRYDHDDFSSYVVGIRDFRPNGVNFQTAITLTRFNADTHTPVSSRTVHPFSNVPAGKFSNALKLNAIYIYDAVDKDEPDLSRSWLLYEKLKSGKLLTYLEQFDSLNLRRIQRQVLIGPNDPILRSSDQFYGLYGVGFAYYDDDDWRKPK